MGWEKDAQGVSRWVREPFQEPPRVELDAIEASFQPLGRAVQREFSTQDIAAKFAAWVWRESHRRSRIQRVPGRKSGHVWRVTVEAGE